MKLLFLAPLFLIMTANPERVIIRRNNDVVGVFTDGWICYGTRVPREIVCHRAIEKPKLEPTRSGLCCK